MDCNKEEAVRAKEIAEQRLTQEDYAGAQKMALKAEQLFPQLENLSQLLTVCEIHCSAQMKINGLHDWYKILQVAPESDENLIRRQFRKFALLLHPDKNKLPGAEAAFKLVGEAHKTLSDRYSRSMYDIKRLQIVRPAGPPHQSKNNNSSSSHNSSFSNFSSSNQPRPQQQPQQPQPQPQPQPQHGLTFWTICTNCKTHHQYNRNIILKTVRCVLCSRNFTANISPPPNPVHMPGARNQPQHFSGQPQAQAQAQAQKSGVRGTTTTSHSTAWIGKKPESNKSNPKPVATNASGLNGVVSQRSKRVSADTSKSDAAAAASASSNPNTNPNPEINPQHDADDTKHDDKKQTDSAPNAADADGSTPRRSARFKRDVNSNDIEAAGVSTAAKKARVEVNSKGNGFNCADATNVKNTSVKNSVEKDLRERSNQKGKEKVEPSGLNVDHTASQAAPNSHKNTQIGAAAGRSESSDTKYVYPDPEFCDFDKLKDVKKFAVNQIWALYDNLDAMPRFYGKIRDISSTESGFKVKYTWLEHKPVNETEAAWSDEELPVGCGNYTLGETETTDDRLIFSHMILDEKEKKKGGPYVILPKKGEVWAVFKNWDIKWSQKTKKKNKKYEYEVVEVLSDFSRINGIRVVPLVKVEGFVSVFARIQNWVPTHIPHCEMLRFSHSIPSFRLSGSERDDLPEGSLELDTVALPTNFATAFPSVCINSVNTQTQCHEKNDRDESERCESPHPNIDSVYQIPDSDFHNFDLYRTCDLFQRGQIWAVYSDLDTYPKYYGYIRKVDPEPFKVLVSWLEADPTSEVEREWLNATLPVSCGKFKVSNKNMTFSEGTFSHMVSTKQYRGKYEILPQVGEIWAVYKNWSAKWTLDDLDKCEYDIVEIKEQREESILVWPLKQVTGYTAVFMPERVGEIGSAKLEIFSDEYIIFSHRIPAVGLTEERGGKLRGYWELDPASVPDQFLYRDN